MRCGINKRIQKCPLLHTSVKKDRPCAVEGQKTFVFAHKKRVNSSMGMDLLAFFVCFLSHSTRHSCVRKRPPVRHQVALSPTPQAFLLSFLLPPGDDAAATAVFAWHKVDRCESKNRLLSRNHPHASKQKESQTEKQGNVGRTPPSRKRGSLIQCWDAAAAFAQMHN